MPFGALGAAAPAAAANPWAIPAILLFAAVASGVGAAQQNRQAIEEQKKAQQANLAIKVEENKKVATQTRRAAYVRAAAIRQMASNTGGTGGSGVAGAVGSIASMSSGSIGFQNMQAQNAMNVGRMNTRAANNQSKAIGWQATGDLFKGGLSAYMSDFGTT